MKKILLILIIILSNFITCHIYAIKNPTTVNNLNPQKINIIKSLIYRANYSKALQLLNLINSNNYLYNNKLYLQALIYFIQNKYDKTLKILKNNSFNLDENYSKICLIKVLSLIATNSKTKKINNEIQRCIVYSDQNNFHVNWLDVLSYMNRKNNQRQRLKKLNIYQNFLTSKTDTKRTLKMGLFINDLDLLADSFTSIPNEFFQDNEIKELIAFTYYRLHKKKTALKMVHNLTTPNAYNLRGNIFLNQKQYEIAIENFKLALQQNPRSKNAIERIIILSWIMNKPEQVINNLQKQIKVIKNNKFYFLYLTTLAQLDKNKMLQKIINNNRLELNPNQLSPFYKYLLEYLHFNLYNLKKSKLYSKNICKKFAMSCYKFLHLMYYKKFMINYKNNKLEKLVKQRNDKNFIKIKHNLKNEKIYIKADDILELDLLNKNKIKFGNIKPDLESI